MASLHCHSWCHILLSQWPFHSSFRHFHINDLASQAEDAASRGEQGRVFKITELVCGRYRGGIDTLIMDKQGWLLTTESEEDTMDGTLQWSSEQTTTTNRGRYTRGRDRPGCHTHPPEKKRSLQPSSPSRTEKSPGQDNLSAEVFKADPQLTANLLQLLFTDIREGKKLPEDWTDRVIVNILKKGALNNWQGITLLSVPGKILAKMKLTQWTNNWEESWQGFGKERDAHTRSSPCVTSWSSAQSGRDNSTSTF